MATANAKSPHFFDREADGSVRLRLRFDDEAASRIEEAAGKVPLIEYIHQAIGASVARDIEQARLDRPDVRPS